MGSYCGTEVGVEEGRVSIDTGQETEAVTTLIVVVLIVRQAFWTSWTAIEIIFRGNL